MVAKDPTGRALRVNRVSVSAEGKGAAVGLLPLCSNAVECLLNRTQGSFFLSVQLAGLGRAFSDCRRARNFFNFGQRPTGNPTDQPERSPIALGAIRRFRVLAQGHCIMVGQQKQACPLQLEK